ncbi:hypothetical protein SAMN05443287_107288 [Micromonospora phaseoli]|uniref:Uncharacterized protein n=1 Tax=Micromonospora phaseoli TaxID=1144548 RepID=A0A1H7BUZ8_9ACTN|nr:hypothetical protein [Micromonospora phaseoli]PZV94940.1 hypothetical protein CLV64_10875 [Micromonospora phaseoli]GIJ79785.1 hypothetical protein Xph01_42170 [Micromonospora phaseoli]SEJ77195.1 hypothetical protein SAMN05443287_107288 [Micromonospora phaseoli]
MSYPEQAPARRPAVVVLAVALLAVMALGALGYAAAGLSVMGGTVTRFRAAAVSTSASGTDVDAVVTLLRVSFVLSAVLSVLAGVLLVGLALGLVARRSGARVATWVVAGLGMCCGCGGVAALVVQRATPLDFGDDRATAELLNLIPQAHPSWWIPLSATLSVGQVLGYLVVAVLLAMPGANAWFRRRPAPQAPAPGHQPPAPPYQSYPPPAGYPPPAPPYQPYPPPPGAPTSPPYPPR